MRYVIQNLQDITDSREIMDARPHKFGFIFIYILSALIITGILWSYFSEKEIAINAKGIVRPNNEIIKVSNKISGEILQSNFKDGDRVKQGDVLYVIEHESLLLQRENYDKILKEKEEELLNLEKFISSLKGNTNYFKRDNPKERNFYDQYINYEQSIKDSSSQRKVLEKQSGSYREDLDNLMKFKKSLEENKNYLNSSSPYYYQYLSYSSNLEALMKALGDARERKDELTSQNASEEELKEIENTILSVEKEIQDLKNSTLGVVMKDMEQLQRKIGELNDSINADSSVERIKSSTMASINESIKSVTSSISELKLNLEVLNKQIEDCIIKAGSEGVLSVTNSADRGDYLNAGMEVATILPEDPSEYKFEIYIDNKDIGNIKEGQEASFYFLSLPYKDFGSVGSKITNISADAKINPQTGASYYVAEAVMEDKYLTNKRGDRVEIKAGMVLNSQIISRRVKYFHYFLEKLNFKS